MLFLGIRPTPRRGCQEISAFVRFQKDVSPARRPARQRIAPRQASIRVNRVGRSASRPPLCPLPTDPYTRVMTHFRTPAGRPESAMARTTILALAIPLLLTPAARPQPA